MSNETLFYVCGIVLAVSAVAVSFAGLRSKGFPGRFGVVVALWFIALVGGATTFAVLHAQDEEHHEAAELSKASEEVEGAEAEEPIQEGSESEAGGGSEAKQPAAQGGGGAVTTLQLAADPTQIAFDTTSLAAKAGEVTIDFENPSALEHDVAIEQGDKEIAKSETITEGKTSVSADLEPGTYIFLCTVPGHAEAGMEGTLTVK
jgi:plastocyanin